MWVALWSVLVIGAIAVPALLAWDLWARVKAVGREVAELSDALSPHLTPDDPPAGAHATLLEPGTADRARRARRSNREERAARRATALRDARRRWAGRGLA